MIDLDTSLADVKSAGKIIASDAIRMDDPSARVRLSHSTMGLLRGCERKFQKSKLLLNPGAREESAAMSFGKAFGAAVQLYFILRTEGETVQVAQDSGIWEIFKQYSPLLEDDRRFLERCIFIFIEAQHFLERQLMEWEIAVFEGKYASELSFKLDITPRYYYVGYLDLVLKHRKTGRYAVTDVKSTALWAQNLEPVYKFSDQVIGYSIILDKIVGPELAHFDTNYWVAQIASRSIATLYEPKFHALNFQKTLQDRFEWFLKLYMDVNRIQSLEKLTVYPKRDNCMAYNKVCQYYQTCQFTMADEPGVYIPDEIDYQFVYNIDDVFADHQRRLAS